MNIVPEIYQRRTYVRTLKISNKVQEGGHLYLNAYNCTVPIFCSPLFLARAYRTVPYPLLVGSEIKILNVRFYICTDISMTKTKEPVNQEDWHLHTVVNLSALML